MTQNNRNHFVAIASLLVLLMLGACGGDTADSKAPAADSVDAEPAQNKAAGPVFGGNKGNMAPEFNLVNIAGGQLSLSSLKGKAVIIDFWDTWCPPCRRALPGLDAISQTYSDDLVVVGIAFGRDGIDKVRQYVSQNNLTFPMVLSDEKFQVAKDFGGVQSIPTTFLIDRDGLIVEKWTGGHAQGDYEAAVKKLLGS